MSRVALAISVTVVCLGLFVGCGGSGFAYEKRLSGKYALIAVDVMEQMDVSEVLSSGSATSIISATVYAAGWNDQFIIAKQHPAGPNHTFDKTVTNFYILKVSDGSVTGPVNEATFDAERTKLGVPQALAFTLVFENLK